MQKYVLLRTNLYWLNMHFAIESEDVSFELEKCNIKKVHFIEYKFILIV